MPRKQRYIHKSDFMSERMLLLNTALAGLKALQVGFFLGIILFMLMSLAVEVWPSLVPLRMHLTDMWMWATVMAAWVLLALHHHQLPTLHRALIGIVGLHLPIVLGLLGLFLFAFGGRILNAPALGGIPKPFICLGVSVGVAFFVWRGTRQFMGQTRIVTMTNCLQCNYSLRGLASNKCPECGDEIVDVVDVLGKGDAHPVQVSEVDIPLVDKESVPASARR